MVTHKQAEDRVNAGFWIHSGCYIAVVGGLAGLNYLRNPDNPWILWVASGWGIGIAAHAMAFFSNREKLIDRAVERIDRREERQERRDVREASSHISEMSSRAGDEFQDPAELTNGIPRTQKVG